MPMSLKICSNGGLKIYPDWLAQGCCDQCEIDIEKERNRIKQIPWLVSMTEYGSGMLVVTDSNNQETRYDCKAVFLYVYKQSQYDYIEHRVLEYFDCENCEIHVVSSYQSYRFLQFDYICSGCVFKYKDQTLLATIDESGPSDYGNTEPIRRFVYEYTNNSQTIQYVYIREGGDVAPENKFIDNWIAVESPRGYFEHDHFSALLYPSDTMRLYIVNEPNPDSDFYNPWEIHCKIYMAEVTCDPCEVAVYKKKYESSNETLGTEYGAGFYTGGGANTPYQQAFVMTYNHFTMRLYGVTCDTCEIVLLESWSAWEEHTVAYTEDETACDDEDEVQ